MKKIFAYLCLLMGIALLLVSCNEELRIDAYIPSKPAIFSFTPTSGPVGTLVTVKGRGLNNIQTAKINGVEVTIKHHISGSEMILQTSVAAGSGILTLEGSDGLAQTTEEFIYTYPTPEITTYPSTYMVGDLVVFFGLGLDAILDVKFNTTQAEIISKRPSELVVKVPDLRATHADVIFAYYNGTSEISITQSQVEVIRRVPQVTSLSPSSSVVVGDEVTATGQFLHLVEKVTIGSVEARITSQPENGLSLTFRVSDNKAFADGENTKALVFYSFNQTEMLDVKSDFSFVVPKFYTWKSANLNAHSIQKLNHFFCLDTGETYTADDFAAQVDPLAISKGGEGCVDKNKLASTTTQEEYYGVKPYIYFAYLGSGCYFYGPANSNNRISNFKTSNGQALMVSGKAYGTPIILFRTLSESTSAEMALITKIKSGNFASDDFSAALFDEIDLTKSGTDSDDGWSNIPNSEFGAFKAKAAANHRPWAPMLTAADQTGTFEPGTVVLVMYFKPNWSTFVVNTANVYKFGFIEITKLIQDKTLEGGRQNNATFNVYWQRTPFAE